VADQQYVPLGACNIFAAPMTVFYRQLPVCSFGMNWNIIEDVNLRQKCYQGGIYTEASLKKTLFHHHVHFYESAYIIMILKCMLAYAMLKCHSIESATWGDRPLSLPCVRYYNSQLQFLRISTNEWLDQTGCEWLYMKSSASKDTMHFSVLSFPHFLR